MTKTLKWLGGGVAAVMLLGLAGLFSGEAAEAQSSPTGPPHRFAGSVTLDGEAAAAGTSVTAVVNGAECGSATVITSAAGSTYVVDVPDSCADAGDTVSFQVGGYDAAESGTWSGGGRTDLDLSASSAMPEEPMDDMADECPDEMADDMGEGDMGEGDTGDSPAEPDEPAEPMDDPAEPDEPAEPMDDMGDDMGDGMADDCPTDDMADDMDDDMADDDMADDDMADDDMADDDMADDMADDDMAPEVADTGTGLSTTSSSLAAILGVTALAILLGSYTFARRRR